MSGRSQQLFNFQRFAVVMEYEEKPILPAPFTIASHTHLLVKHVRRCAAGNAVKFESGLMLFLGKFDMERLYDFEEEGVEAYLRAQEDAAAKNMDAKIKGLIDVSEELRSKLYDLERWESLSQEANSHLDFRMQRYLLLENLNFI